MPQPFNTVPHAGVTPTIKLFYCNFTTIMNSNANTVSDMRGVCYLTPAGLWTPAWSSRPHLFWNVLSKPEIPGLCGLKPLRFNHCHAPCYSYFFQIFWGGGISSKLEVCREGKPWSSNSRLLFLSRVLSGTFCTLEITNRGRSQARTPSVLETELNASTWQVTGWSGRQWETWS